jgi:hypothetical protein
VTAARLLEDDQTIRVLPRQRLHQYTVSDAEQRRRTADPERHRQHDEHGEARLTPEETARIANVLRQAREAGRRRGRRFRNGGPARVPPQRGRVEPPSGDLRGDAFVRVLVRAAVGSRLFVQRTRMLGQLLDDILVGGSAGRVQLGADATVPVHDGLHPSRFRFKLA